MGIQMRLEAMGLLMNLKQDWYFHQFTAKNVPIERTRNNLGQLHSETPHTKSSIARMDSACSAPLNPVTSW